MANILFVHANFPGQFLWLARELARYPAHVIKALSAANADTRLNERVDGIEVLHYGAEVTLDRPAQHILSHTETFIRNAASLALQADALKRGGFYPDVIYTHTGWGVGAFLHNVFPSAKQIKYCEWYYNRPETGIRFLRKDQQVERIIADDLLNLPLLAELSHADRLIAPTEWQRQQFPPAYRDQITVIPDGLDPTLFERPLQPSFLLDDGRRLTRDDRIVTYVARGADMFRGFETFVQAIARLQTQFNDFHCLIACDTKSYYGPGHGTEDHFRDVMQATALDPQRVHFLGTIDRQRYLGLLRVSTVHVYLTVPFVLSWSMLEAMAAGCIVVASDTPPVAEFITAGVNGHLVDFFDADALSDGLACALNESGSATAMREAARDSVLRRWGMDIAMEAHKDLLRGLDLMPASAQVA